MDSENSEIEKIIATGEAQQEKQLENIFIEVSAFGALQTISIEEKSIIKDDLTILAINGE